MNLIRRSLAPLLGVLLAASFLAAPAHAQLDETPQALNAAAITEMKAENWGKALAHLTRCVELYDKNAMTLFGPRFGVFWYRKGYCELKLGRFDEAAKSFETCYRKYPNDAAQAQSGGNVYNKRALLYWGQAAQGGEKWGEAIRMYKKFLEERDPTRDKFQPGSFYINMAICHFKENKIADGIQHFETALKNKVRYETPEAGIVAAFQALVDAVIEKRDEDALLGFVAANRSDIVIEPYDMQSYNDLFLSLAGKAYDADMERSAFALYQLLPSSAVMLQDIKSRLDRMGNRPGVKDGTRTIRRSTLEASREALQKKIRSGDPHEVIQLSATAFLHEDHGNVRGSFAAYEQIELFYPKSRKRERNLYNLVRTASLIGEVVATEKYGSRFLKDFPDSKHVPAVRRLMLTSLFYGGEYEKCVEIASVMLPKLEPGTKEHDICLHVLGGSYYYTARFKEAQPKLDEHVETYPKSQFEIAALFFQASNLSRLQFWAKSAKLLDAFLEKYPEADKNIYLPFALYDRANCHYAEDEPEAALEKLDRIEGEFPDVEVIEQTYNLKGNVLQNLGRRGEAEEYYAKALEVAERRGNDIVAGESLYYLVAMLGEKPKKKDDPNRLEDAVPFADRFWEDYGIDSPYKAQVAVAQVHALDSVGRGEEALERLRDVIAEMADTPGAVGLEEAIGSYTEVYLDKHSPEELKDHYYNFPGIRASNKVARALLRIAIIGVFEDQLRKAKDDESKRMAAEANIQVLFRDLKSDYDVRDLSNFILVKVGDFIRGTNSPREALPYYNELLGRDDKSYMFPALFGRGAVLAVGGDDDKRKALEDFQRVFNDSQERADKDRALFQTIVTKMDLEDFEGAKDDARAYLDRETGFSTRKPEVGLMLAESWEGMGKMNDAIAAYLYTYESNKGLFSISLPALKRYMELRWDRNLSTDVEGQSDRQKAYDAGRSFIDLTRRILDKASPEEQEQWKEIEELVRIYEADKNVKSKEEQLEEQKR